MCDFISLQIIFSCTIEFHFCLRITGIFKENIHSRLWVNNYNKAFHHDSKLPFDSKSVKSVEKTTSIKKYHSCFVNYGSLLAYLFITLYPGLLVILCLLTKCSFKADIALAFRRVKPLVWHSHSTELSLILKAFLLEAFQHRQRELGEALVRYGSSDFPNINKIHRIESWYSRWKDGTKSIYEFENI